MASGLQCNLWEGWGEWAYFFFTSAPGRLQLPGLQNSEGLGLESSLRLFVEREGARCHSDFCPLVLQALPPTGAECLWADSCWIVGERGSVVCKVMWVDPDMPQAFWVTWFDRVRKGCQELTDLIGFLVLSGKFTLTTFPWAIFFSDFMLRVRLRKFIQRTRWFIQKSHPTILLP